MHLSKFIFDRSGNTAMMFALIMLPLLAVIGLALDVSRHRTAQTQFDNALDAAALTSARLLGEGILTQDEIKAEALDLFRADMANAESGLDCLDPNIVFDMATNDVQISSSCVLPTTLAGLVGVDQFNVSGSSTASANKTRLDLALMLDVSGSMAGTKMTALQDAANVAIDMLIPNNNVGRVRIAIAPYSTAVNAGVYGGSVIDPGIYDPQSPSANCATERLGLNARTDAAPGINKWLANAATLCPAAGVVALSEDKAMLHTQIDALVAESGTAGHLGVAWAWYLISPKWAGIFPPASAPHAYTDPISVKAVILMTDGEFNTEYEISLGDSTTQARELCSRMRAEGIIIYSVAFEAPVAGQQILKQCATSPAHYFEATGSAELMAAYRNIAAQLNSLRLVD